MGWQQVERQRGEKHEKENVQKYRREGEEGKDIKGKELLNDKKRRKDWEEITFQGRKVA